MLLIILVLILLFIGICKSLPDIEFEGKYENFDNINDKRVQLMTNLLNLTVHDAMIYTDRTSTSSLFAYLSEFGLIPIVHHDKITGFRPIYDPRTITMRCFDKLIN
jgi:hypothetical protein